MQRFYALVFMHLYKLYFSAAWGQGSPQARQCLQMSPGEFLRRDKSKIKPALGTCAICQQVGTCAICAICAICEQGGGSAIMPALLDIGFVTNKIWGWISFLCFLCLFFVCLPFSKEPELFSSFLNFAPLLWMRTNVQNICLMTFMCWSCTSKSDL